MVVFTSSGTDHVAGITDSNGVADLFAYDPATAGITLLTPAAGLANAANGVSLLPSVSSNGRYVVFLSAATNLIAGLTDNILKDVFWLDRQTGTTRMVSHAAGSSLVSANGPSTQAKVSADGQWVVYTSLATNLVTGQSDTNSAYDVFLWSAATGNSVLVSHYSSSSYATPSGGDSLGADLSSDGSWVVFTSKAGVLGNYGYADQNGAANGDVFTYQRSTTLAKMISFNSATPTWTANNDSSSPTISDDGNWVVYSSKATNVASGPDTNGVADVVLYNRAAGSAFLVSVAYLTNTAANGESTLPSISPSGTHVVFQSRPPTSSAARWIPRRSTSSATTGSPWPGSCSRPRPAPPRPAAPAARPARWSAPTAARCSSPATPTPATWSPPTSTATPTCSSTTTPDPRDRVAASDRTPGFEPGPEAVEAELSEQPR